MLPEAITDHLFDQKFIILCNILLILNTIFYFSMNRNESILNNK